MSEQPKRRYLSQADVPRHSLDEALRIPRALADEYGKGRATPLDVAAALQMQPSSGGFRSLAGAALAYGLTDGGPNADDIGLTDLGLRVVAPTEEGDDQRAKQEALMRPRVVREFLEKYNAAKVPSEPIGRNVLERMGVPQDATKRTFELIIQSAAALGVLREINGQQYVHLRASPTPPLQTDRRDTSFDGEELDVQELPSVAGPTETETPQAPAPPTEALLKNRRFFISHGSNRKIVDQLKELLIYGDFEPVVSVDAETTAKPVPEKVLSDMRSCSAGIIHVGREQTVTDGEGREIPLVNQNVLIEIGAAMALYGSNYVLLVEEGVNLPSNLQGLYEARYRGDALDHDATMKLLRTLKELKTRQQSQV
jgi:predicted nucleotide-binding protein